MDTHTRSEHLAELLAAGWRVQPQTSSSLTSSSSPSSGAISTPEELAASEELAVDLPVRTLSKLVQTITDIAAIAKAEKHHPDRLVWEHSRLHVAVHTHTAMPPYTTSALDTTSGKNTEGTGATRPGLTLRDARFAVLVHNAFTERYIPPKPKHDAAVSKDQGSA
ncbi:hypothetical protein CYLTODRAFT_82856 [Cylindrobasidium torrendii FP15055 ss-10]|uniref:Uncharacterized protein n=1 Tax=Cylindrobasidium torrendii FP15055 ss-10 TaxID=1314674 RepID=A0A0D7B3T7_9AGAR|nr:hypothetical protein CYLTODRAFT_82856 [Cylindrobasidium torrendii FP15055 ss-10]